MSQSLVTICNASKKYLNKSFDININQEDIIILSGENGSGKSTFIKLILGLISPNKGSVTRKKKIKFSFLQEKSKIPKFLVTNDYIDMIYQIDKENFDEKFLSDLKIPLNKKIKHLSKGNLQKVAIFTSFLGKSDVIVLDEPFSGLDDSMVEKVINKIYKENNKGKAFIISTHKPIVFKTSKVKRICL